MISSGSHCEAGSVSQIPTPRSLPFLTREAAWVMAEHPDSRPVGLNQGWYHPPENIGLCLETFWLSQLGGRGTTAF